MKLHRQFRMAPFVAVLFVTVATLLVGGQSGFGAATAPLTVLRVGFDPDFRPSSFTEKSGTLVGVDVDASAVLARHMHVQVKNIGVAWDGIIPALQANKIDTIAGMVITDKRKEVVGFSNPYAFETVTTVVRANEPASFSPGKDNLAQLKVGVMINTSAAQVLASMPGVKPTTYNTAADEYNDLILGRIDVVAIESVNAGYTAKAMYPGKLRVTNNALAGRVYNAFAVRKGDTQLIEAMNTAIAAMIRDGSLAAVYKKWYGNVNVIP